MLSFRRHSDEQVVRRVLSGRRDDFAILVQRYLAVVHALGCAQMGNVADAEDVAQEAFFKAYQQLGDLREPRKFGAWLLTIARNVCRNFKRAAARASERERVAAPPVEGRMPDPGRDEIRALLRQRITELDEVPREILLLRYYAGKRVKEIASLLDISPDAAKKRLQRAREALSSSMLRELEPALESQRSAKQRVSSVMGLVAGAPVSWQPVAGTAAGAGATTVSAVALKIVVGAAVIAALGVGAWSVVTRQQQESGGESRAYVTAPDTAEPTAEPRQEETESTRPGSAGALGKDSNDTVAEAITAALKDLDAQDGETLRCLVLDEAGSPAPQARVRIYEAPEGWFGKRKARARNGVLVAEGETDGQGLFDATGLPERPVLVEASTANLMDLAIVNGTSGEPEYSVTLQLNPCDPISGVVLDTDGQPVRGARILPQLVSPSLRDRHVWYHEMWAESDDKGGFTVGPLPRGVWKLEATASGYASLMSDHVPTGERVRVVLPRGATISGIVIDSETEEPISGVGVRIGTQVSESPTVKTNAQGRFRLAHISPGAASVALKDSTYVLVGDAPALRVSDGEHYSDVKVQVARGGVIEGRVYGAQTGEAPKYVCVIQALRKQKDLADHNLLAEVDQQGNYRFEGLPAGDYEVNVFSGGEYSRGGEEDVQQISVSLRQKITDIDFALLGGVAISGKVVDETGQPVAGARICSFGGGHTRTSTSTSQEDGTFGRNMRHGESFRLVASKRDMASAVLGPFTAGEDACDGIILTLGDALSISGMLVDTTGRPVVGAELSIFTTEGPNLVSEPKATTLAGGEFRFAPILPATYQVHLKINNDPFLHVTPNQLTVSEGRSLRNVELTVESMGDLAITGRITDRRGNPIPGAEVMVKIWPPKAKSRDVHVSTDLDGTYTASGLVPGEYLVWVSPIGYAPAQVEEIPAGSKNVDFALDEVARVKGRVVHARTGAPIQEFEVAHAHVLQVDGVPKVGSYEKCRSEEGEFELTTTAPNPEQILTVVARAPGLAPGHQIAEAQPGKTTTGVEIRLEPAAVIEGTVIDTQGNPIPDAFLFFDELPWPLKRPFLRKEHAAATTAEDGRFVIDMTPEDVATLFAVHPDYALGQHPVLPGASQEIGFVLDSPAVIEGRVRVDGRPAPNQRVTFSCRRAGMPYESLKDHATTDESGNYRLDIPASTEVTVSVSLYRLLSEPGAEPQRGYPIGRASRRVLAETGHATVVDFDAPSGSAAIEGRVTLFGAAPTASRVLVEVRQDDACFRLGSHGPIEDGPYRIESVPAGQVTLIAMAVTDQNQSQMTRRVPFEVTAGRTYHHDFRLGGTCVLTGRVAGGEHGAYVALLPGKVAVTEDLLRDYDWLEFRTAGRFMLKQAEAFRIEGIEPGTYTVVVLGARVPARAAAVVTLEEGSEASVELALE